MQRALGLFKKDTRPENTLNSAVGLYGAAALMLMGALAGGKLGEKTTEVGEKVAWNRGEEVEEEMQEKTGQDLPELVWDEVCTYVHTYIPTYVCAHVIYVCTYVCTMYVRYRTKKSLREVK